MGRKLKICLACSAGGHLRELMRLKDVFKVFERHEVFFLTFKRVDSKDLNAHFVVDPRRNPIGLLVNVAQTIYILAKERPDVIVSTGAGVAVAACYIGKLLGSKVIFIETFCRPTEGSLSGRIVYSIADLFLVQWRRQLEIHGKKAIYGGAVI